MIFLLESFVIGDGDGMKIFPLRPSEPKLFFPNEKSEPSVVRMTLCCWPHLIDAILWPYNDWTTWSMGSVYS